MLQFSSSLDAINRHADMQKLVVFLSFLTFLLSACQLSELTANLIEIPPGGVIYQDDFSDPSSGWEIYSNSEIGTMDYFDGYYRLHVLGDHQLLSTGPGLNFTDLHLEADLIKVVGSEDDVFGLVCRAVDPQNYYFFVVSSDGYYGIGRMEAGVQKLLSSPGMLPSEVIRQGKTMNHLQVDCIADRLTLSVNGQELASVADNDLTNGDAGILAGTLADSENVVLFDNFSVTKP